MPHSTDNAIGSPGVFERAEKNFAAHQQAIFQDTDRMFAVLMAVQWVAGIAAALWISPRTWVGTVSQTSTNVWAAHFSGWRHQLLSHRARSQESGQLRNPLRDCDCANADVGAVDTSNGRPDRNSLSRIWLIGFSVLLSRSEGVDSGDNRGGAGSYFARSSLAGIGLWRFVRQSMALVRTRGLGSFSRMPCFWSPSSEVVPKCGISRYAGRNQMI